MQSKSIFALKAVNLQNLSERSKNDLIKEIVFLEKLKNCNGVVKVNNKLSFENPNIIHILFRLLTMSLKRPLTPTGCMSSWRKVIWTFSR